MGIVSIGIGLIAIALARPGAGNTPPVQSQTIGINEGVYVLIGGLDQWVALRGRDAKNPVLLIVGGPGAALSAMAPFFEPWEQDFTVVHWDQPGAGATFAKQGESATGPLSLDRLTRDGIAVAEFVASRLGRRPIVLLGISAGSIVGLQMVKQRPDLFAAYAGTGQVVNWGRQERLAYDTVLRTLRASGNQEAAGELAQFGPPPYEDPAGDATLGKYAGMMTPAEQKVFATLDPGTSAALKTPQPDAGYVPRGVTLPDVRTRASAAFTSLKPEIRAFDADRLGLTYGIPMLFLQGEHDAYTATFEVRGFANRLRAPSAQCVEIPGGGHSSWVLRAEFLATLNRHLRPLIQTR